MASITITLISVCSGGNHFTFDVTGDITNSLVLDTENIQSQSNDETLKNIITGVIRLAKKGRTMNQLKTLFQSGVTLTV